MGSDADGASSSSKVYSLRGKKLGEDRYEALKLTSEEDIQPYVDEIAKVQGLEEIHLGGNTLGIGACKALGSALETQKNLKVGGFCRESSIGHERVIRDVGGGGMHAADPWSASRTLRRWPTLPTSLPGA